MSISFFKRWRMFPAQAGMNRPVEKCNSGQTDVPRAGGDEPILAELTYIGNECSPRRRG